MRYFSWILGTIIVIGLLRALAKMDYEKDWRVVKWILYTPGAIVLVVAVLSAMGIEQESIDYSRQGVITELTTHSADGQVKRYELVLQGMTKHGAFVPQVKNITFEVEGVDATLAKAVQQAHVERQVVFLKYRRTIYYFMRDDQLKLLELQSSS